MSQSTRKADTLQEQPSNRPHKLSIAVPEEGTDRKPHSYERWLIAKLLRMAGNPPVRFQLWNDEIIESDLSAASFTLRLADPKALYQLVSNPNLAFGDLYSSGRLEVEGDLSDLMTALYRTVHKAGEKWPKWLEAVWRNHNPRSTSVSDARENIHHHYDLGNEFYKLWHLKRW